MASLDYYCEDCEVCGIHSGNARCLGQGFWMVTLEFFTALETNGCAFVIVQPGGNADAFVAFRVGGRPFLLHRYRQRLSVEIVSKEHRKMTFRLVAHLGR